MEERARRAAGARELFEETGTTLSDLSGMRPVSRWITPAAMPVRFDKWFYAVELPLGEEPIADGREFTSIEWVDPRAHVDAALRGEVSLMLPTLAHLDWLARQGAGWRDWVADPIDDPIEPQVRRLADGTKIAEIPEDRGFRVTRSILARKAGRSS